MVLELDQYADGKAARLWSLYIGDQSERTRHYKQFLKRQLSAYDCHSVLDVACGTGIDSVMLIEEGFRVTSCDFSDKMLKAAWHTRWRRRKEAAFDSWDIYEANWLTLAADLGQRRQYDAVICLGNSFAHLPDLTGNQDSHRLALRNFADMVKPGGILLIDHRNYDYILDQGRAPTKNIYYNSQYVSDIRTSVVYQNGFPAQIILDYVMRDPAQRSGGRTTDNTADRRDNQPDTADRRDNQPDTADRRDNQPDTADRLDNEPPPPPPSTAPLLSSASQKDNEFTLTYYPHRVASFRHLLEEAFEQHGASITTLGDFQPLEQISEPAFFIHVVRKLPPGQPLSNGCPPNQGAASWQGGGASSSGEESI